MQNSLKNLSLKNVERTFFVEAESKNFKGTTQIIAQAFFDFKLTLRYESTVANRIRDPGSRNCK